MTRKPTPTIRDVADRAGVSAGTVSAVVNQRASVKDSTRTKVLAAISALGYRPSRPARQLRMSTSDIGVATIGVVIKEIRNPFYADILKGASDAASELGAEVFAASSEGSVARERQIIQHLLRSGVDALILAPVLNSDTDLGHLYDLKRSGHPLVLLEPIPWIQADVVSVDNREMAKQAAMHLIDQGHTHIVHFAGPPYTAHSLDRVEGFKDAFSESRLTFSPDLIIPAGASLQEGYETGKEYFATANPRPTAVTCFNDLLAVGLLRALWESGLRVPDDVSIVGFDGDPMGAYLNVPLTTVVGKNVLMGRTAVERILELAKAPAPIPPERLRIPAELVIRQSSTRS